MNIQEYISSGILESYVLGNAAPEEKMEVEQYASLYPEIKAELDEIEKVLNEYAIAHSIQPPSYLKERVSASVSVGMGREREFVPARSRSDFFYWSVAATFLLLVSTGFAVYFGLRMNKLDGYLNDMAKVNSALADSIKAISSNLSQMQNDAAILKDPMYKIIDLKGQKVAPEAQAMVCWCPMDKKVYVEIDKLPPAPSGMQYQLWAFVDGQPVNEGMLTSGNGLHRMSDVDNADGFAVTLEKAGGSPTPTGEIYVKGTI